MMNDLAPEISGLAAWVPFTKVEGSSEVNEELWLRAHLSNTAILPALTYASEIRALRKQDEHAVNVIQRAVGRKMLGVSLITQMSNRNFRQIYFYEFKLGRTAVQTARDINEVWGQESVNECTVQRWFQKFRARNTSLEDEPRGSRPPTLNDTRHCEGTQCPSHYNCSPSEANWED
uniref:HTH_48 domain-containing protein n=1 Tax=Haemonchus contortus TaxID=6289 RepID=A0A7I4Z384_HAECO